MSKFQPTKKEVKTEKIVISIRTRIDMLEKIDKMAYKVNISRNEFINQCIEYALQNMEKK